MIELTHEDFARWDSVTRVVLDYHFERGTVCEVSARETWDGISAAQERVQPFFIVGRALEQRRKGNDDFRVRQIDGAWEEHRDSLLAYLIEAFYRHSPAAGLPRALVVPRWMKQRLISAAMTAAIANTLSFAPVANDSPQMMFLGVPVLHEMNEKPF